MWIFIISYNFILYLKYIMKVFLHIFYDCRIITIIKLTSLVVPISVQLADKNKIGSNSIQNLIFVKCFMSMRVWHIAFFIVGTRGKTVTHTYLAVSKMFWAQLAFPPQNGCFWHQPINRGQLEPGGTAPWGSRTAGLSVCDMNASFPVSMSDDLDWLPPEPRYTWPDPYIRQHGWLKCFQALWARL